MNALSANRIASADSLGRILLVDDNDDFLEALSELLEPCGYAIACASSPDQALEVARDVKPEVALLDLNLGSSSGLDLVPLLRQQQSDIVCVIMTGYANIENTIEAVRSGVEDYLRKPIDPKELVRRMPSYLRQHRLTRDKLNAEQALKDSERRLSAIMENVADALLTIDADGCVESANRAAEKLFGYPVDEIVGMSASDILPVLEPVVLDQLALASAAESMASDAVADVQITNGVRQDGRIVPVDLAISEVHLEDRRIHIVTARDVEHRQVMEDRLRHLSTHDALTGLPNRHLLDDRLAQAIHEADRENKTVAVLFIDLDNFKIINDSLGHNIGDLLLQDVTRRISATIRKRDTLGRLGGDEFLVIASIRRAEDATSLAEKIQSVFGEQVEIEGQKLAVGVSIGIATCPNDSSNPETLLKFADMAMYEAKQAGKNAYRYFTAEMNSLAKKRVELLRSLREALDQRQFYLEYQPQIDIRTQKVAGVEALIRWRHPKLGVIPPLQFIPLAEESGLIGSIGAWVLQEACQQAQEWRDAGHDSLRIAVNVSAQQLQGRKLLQSVRDAIDASGLPPDALELEITESLFLSNIAENVEVLQEIRSSGIRISIDDFGTGYSSLAYLMHLPIDAIKIDRTFIRDACAEGGDGTIVRAIVSLAESLGLEVVAEGIEIMAQLQFVASLGCNFVQGYYFSKPVAPSELVKYCKSAALPALLKMSAPQPDGRDRGTEKMRALPAAATGFGSPTRSSGCNARPTGRQPIQKTPARAKIDAGS